MRQTSKRARRSRLLMIFILVLLIALVLWGLAALADRLLHYGANATVSAKDADQPSAITPTPETADDTPKNTYDPACFYRDGEFLRYESSTVTSQIGIDVSAHQQDIDWQRVAASGVQFAILRVGYRGYTEGSIQEDAYFEQNLAGAIDAGLDVGVYFFSQAMDEQEAREEARFVLDKISGYQLAYPVFFDWEKIGADARSDAMDLTSLTTVTDTFCSEIEAAGYQAGLYFNQQLGYEELHLPSLQGYTFWLAEYNDTPSFTYDFDLWQYASDGSVDGIDGDVDLNLAFIEIFRLRACPARICREHARFWDHRPAAPVHRSAERGHCLLPRAARLCSSAASAASARQKAGPCRPAAVSARPAHLWRYDRLQLDAAV